LGLVAAIDGIVNMPIYRQLFDFLCLASIVISIAKTGPRETLVPEARETCELLRVDAPILPDGVRPL
jgi:hypothetical protein